VRQALAGEPITVYGTGQQSRCFCDVRDCVRSVLHLLTNPQAIGEVVNIGSTEEVSINDLALVVKQRAGSKSPISHIAYDQAYEPGFEDMPRRVPALEKLVGLTGFRPSISLNEIVDGVIAHFRDKQEAGMAKSVTAGAAEGGASAELSAD
jgi:UDP-glucose 4-epimerase